MLTEKQLDNERLLIETNNMTNTANYLKNRYGIPKKTTLQILREARADFGMWTSICVENEVVFISLSTRKIWIGICPIEAWNNTICYTVKIRR